MFKKMGRPTRKGTATTITYNDPNGEIFYFTIDNRGKSNFIGRSPIVTIGCVQHHEPESIIPSSSNENLLEIAQEDAIKSNNIEKMTNNINKNTENYDEIVKFDLFLEKINSHFDLDEVLRENRLSFLPLISA